MNVSSAMKSVFVEFAHHGRHAARLGLILTAFGLAYPVAGRGQATIQADVQEVLVPVVVTDKAGHHVTGMHASDFHITEDGVLQEIVSISTSTSANGLMNAPNDRFFSANRARAPNPGVASSSPKRTYLICIDTLHSTFSNFGRVRQALKRFFDNEDAGDSQYALFALGRQIHVIQDSTRDPAAILAAIASKNFMKTISQTESAKLANDVQQFTYCVTITAPNAPVKHSTRPILPFAWVLNPGCGDI